MRRGGRRAWCGRDRAVLHAGRLFAGGHAEQIAESDHARSLGGGRRLRQIEVRQVGGIDLQQRQFKPRVDAWSFLETFGRR